jgi:hypothetical protein
MKISGQTQLSPGSINLSNQTQQTRINPTSAMTRTSAQPQIEIPTSIPTTPVKPPTLQADSTLWMLMSPILFKLILDYLKEPRK